MTRSMYLLAILILSGFVMQSIGDPMGSDIGTRQAVGPIENLDRDAYYDTIQSAIDDANPGDTILVSPGIYHEHLFIDKLLALTGANSTTTIIDGGGNGTVVQVSESQVNMTGFTIRNSGTNLRDAGLNLIGASNCSVYDLILTHNEVGITIESRFSSEENSLRKIFNRSSDGPEINNAGQVAWRGIDSLKQNQIYYWNGEETVQVTNYTDRSVGDPKLNDKGEMVWLWSGESQDYEVYFWDGSQVHQITDNSWNDNDPVINNRGEIAWSQEGNIMFWDGEGTRNISNGSFDGYRPEINDNGWVVWKGDVEQYHTDIFYWDTKFCKQLGNDTIYEWFPQINNMNQIAWMSELGVHIWENGTITKIAEPGEAFNTKMNERGQIVWLSEDMGDVMFWDGNKVIQVTHSKNMDRPKINNLGHLVWSGFVNAGVYYWNGEDISILTGPENIGGNAQINDNDQVVWSSSWNENYAIYLWGGGDITAEYANSNRIFNNTISWNEHGIRIETAYENNIFHNNFVNNSNQSFCRQSNVWDDGYPSGGNYWSDYNGTDTRSGLGQDLPGRDGIGDEAYVISGGSNIDTYPLMAPKHLSPTLPPDVAPGGANFLWAMIIFGSVIGVGVGLGVATEIIKYSLLALYLPLYMKIRKEEVLDLYLRGKIHGYIIANPGEHYNGIKRALNINNGSLAYHLSILEKEELIKSRNEGVYKCFYPFSMNLNGGETSVTNAQKLILIQIENNPGITQKLVASKLGLHPSTVNYHVRNLEKNNRVRTERKGFGVRYYIK